MSASLVLVVDDEADLRLNMKMFLESEGFDVVVAKHGRSALELLEASEGLPSLILLDLMMPVMDGWEFRYQQVQSYKFKDIPVVAMSAGAHSRAIEVNAVIKKPFDLDQLLATVHHFCSGENPPGGRASA